MEKYIVGGILIIILQIALIPLVLMLYNRDYYCEWKKYKFFKWNIYLYAILCIIIGLTFIIATSILFIVNWSIGFNENILIVMGILGAINFFTQTVIRVISIIIDRKKYNKQNK